MAEVRLSPDGNSSAIRSDAPEEDWRAWGVMDRHNGGHWAATDEVADWAVLAAAP